MAELNPGALSNRRPLALGLLLWIAALGCEADEPACYEGEYLSCSCGDLAGYARCERGSYGVCDCASGTPGLGGAAAAGAGGADGGVDGGGGGMPALLAFMEPCDEDQQCVTGLCFPFNAKGPHCSMPCVEPSDCPPPSPGCSNMGVCKAP